MTTVFFDLETGGLSNDSPDVQLAAIAVNADDWAEAGTFELKLQFDETKADPEALELNHYDRKLWQAMAVPIPVAAERFAEFLEPFRCLRRVSQRTGNGYFVAKLAAHNAAFDGPRLNRMFGTRFLPADPRVLCTLQRALWYFHERGDDLPEPDNYKLETLCVYFGISVKGKSHDALADVRRSIALARKLQA